MLKTAMHYSHELLREIVTTGDHVVDATMGNGNDTLFLAQLVGVSGKVDAFDIQKSALLATQEKLARHPEQVAVNLHLAGHENAATYLQGKKIKAAIFNLGYLPKSDKQIITLPETTKKALTALLEHLLPQGRIILVCYYGHPGGKAELDALKSYCNDLPQERYNVLAYQFINQKNNPPLLLCIEAK
ncbi:rRNA methyltransferase [Enterococcus saigonensis]|uniref:rRNA methyltransferase n=1 Tax=Enterococcus saigonensis TaxID=1805431 RepID=A0A679I8L5_9ENTE|nr:class I SAM-dependent methyltransferase [Enterococcus saigonensis]BCA84750.1 rRNA methyltransferase [Enterococcus saigonensis]